MGENGHAPVKSPVEQYDADRQLMAVILRSAATAMHCAISRDQAILNDPDADPKVKDSASFRIAQNSGVLSRLTPMWLQASSNLMPPPTLAEIAAQVERSDAALRAMAGMR